MKRLDDASFAALSLWFRPGEQVVTGNKFETAPVPFERATKFGELTVVNAMHTHRRDVNATYRNFLIECDVGTLKEQYERVEELKVPWATCTQSGGKSLHFVICLQEPLKTKGEYDELAARIFAIVPQGDQSVKNAGRFCRTPGIVRPETSKLQQLVATRRRVTLAELTTWIDSHPEAMEEVGAHAPKRSGLKTGESLWIPADLGKRRHPLTRIASVMSSLGADEEYVFDVMRGYVDRYVEHGAPGDWLTDENLRALAKHYVDKDRGRNVVSEFRLDCPRCEKQAARTKQEREERRLKLVEAARRQDTLLENAFGPSRLRGE